MPKRYLGNIITDTPTAPAGPYETSAASGVWSLAEANAYTAAGLWPTAGNEAPPSGAFPPDGWGSINYYGDNYNYVSYASGSLGVDISADGTTVVILNSSGGAIYQFSLSTAYALSSVTNDGSYTTGSSSLQSLCFSTDGTSLLAVNYTGVVYNLALSTAYDVTSTVTETNYSTGLGSLARSVVWNWSGNRFYVFKSNGASAGGTVYEYSTNTSFALDSVSLVGSNAVSSSLTDLQEFRFSPDGLHSYVLCGTSNTSGSVMERFTLTTAYDQSTASSDGTYSVNTQETDGHGFCVSRNQENMYVVGIGTTSIYRYQD